MSDTLNGVSDALPGVLNMMARVSYTVKSVSDIQRGVREVRSWSAPYPLPSPSWHTGKGCHHWCRRSRVRSPAGGGIFLLDVNRGATRRAGAITGAGGPGFDPRRGVHNLSDLSRGATRRAGGAPPGQRSARIAATLAAEMTMGPASDA